MASDWYSRWWEPWARNYWPWELRDLLAGHGYLILGGTYVWQTFEGSPAEAAGIQQGDTIVAIDGQPARGPAEQVIPRILGPAGSEHPGGADDDARGAGAVEVLGEDGALGRRLPAARDR